ncbi:hypothetical protein EI546_14280 [Aequorivita sp. H23M31]|uniref:DUF1640 domain-containing protein n=1 Tax=Aequorivita ciconiae TaxID=2494375 RepID=A0A410G6E1_9FLAO|nr:hypothetical protein [Aequorivita sp. H23M31]QAA82810.1 hypothetical protein EI546_14280 [Aequorivita sp. H23M31]
MNGQTSIRLFELVQEFIPDKRKAKEFVSRLEETVDLKFDSIKETMATKTDIAQLEFKLGRAIYIVGLIQFLAIVGSVSAIVNFMLK